jgi:hypothetical protein
LPLTILPLPLTLLLSAEDDNPHALAVLGQLLRRVRGGQLAVDPLSPFGAMPTATPTTRVPAFLSILEVLPGAAAE